MVRPLKFLGHVAHEFLSLTFCIMYLSTPTNISSDLFADCCLFYCMPVHVMSR